MAIATKKPERATYRTVILLHRSEKTKLERLASKQEVSSAEVIRRLIRRGESPFANPDEEQLVEAALKMISAAVSEANESINRTIAKLDQVHAELQKRDIR